MSHKHNFELVQLCRQCGEITEPHTAEDASKQKDGIALIAAERQRQISVEGWTADLDDTHSRGELAEAASAYALTGKITDKTLIRTVREIQVNSSRGIDGVYDYREVEDEFELWPWDGDCHKPSTDLIRNLEKAGALIAAEIDRLLRKAKSTAAARTTRFDVSGCPCPMCRDNNCTDSAHNWYRGMLPDSAFGIESTAGQTGEEHECFWKREVGRLNEIITGLVEKEPDVSAEDASKQASCDLRIQRMKEALEKAELLADKVRDYTTERDYQNVQACKEDLDRRESNLLAALKMYEITRAALSEENKK